MSSEIISELRELIVRAAPDPSQAEQVSTCDEQELLDGIIPFSSLILLGVVVAVEDRYEIRVTRQAMAEACSGGTTLRKLASMIESLQTSPSH